MEVEAAISICDSYNFMLRLHGRFWFGFWVVAKCIMLFYWRCVVTLNRSPGDVICDL